MYPRAISARFQLRFEVNANHQFERLEKCYVKVTAYAAAHNRGGIHEHMAYKSTTLFYFCMFITLNGIVQSALCIIRVYHCPGEEQAALPVVHTESSGLRAARADSWARGFVRRTGFPKVPVGLRYRILRRIHNNRATVCLHVAHIAVLRTFCTD